MQERAGRGGGSAVRPGCTGLWQISPDAGRLIGEAPGHSLRVMVGGAPVSGADIPRWARRRRPLVFDKAPVDPASPGMQALV